MTNGSNRPSSAFNSSKKKGQADFSEIPVVIQFKEAGLNIKHFMGSIELPV
jgi:hypothetical protein